MYTSLSLSLIISVCASLSILGFIVSVSICIECCWAIAVAGTVGCAYYSDYKIKKHEVSPKDLLDRTWYYHHDLMKGKERDAAGCFRCGLKKAFRVVRDYGIAYLENCPFVPSLDEHKGHLKKTDVCINYICFFFTLNITLLMNYFCFFL